MSVTILDPLTGQLVDIPSIYDVPTGAIVIGTNPDIPPNALIVSPSGFPGLNTPAGTNSAGNNSIPTFSVTVTRFNWEPYVVLAVLALIAFGVIRK